MLTGKRANIQHENGHRTRQKKWVKMTGSQIVVARPQRRHAQGALSTLCWPFILMASKETLTVSRNAPGGPDAPPRTYPCHDSRRSSIHESTHVNSSCLIIENYPHRVHTLRIHNVNPRCNVVDHQQLALCSRHRSRKERHPWMVQTSTTTYPGRHRH
jgi:hypothetical protein